MKNEKFKVANLVKELIMYIDKSFTNFPKKEIELKHEIKQSSYNLLLVIYEANTSTNMDLKKKAIAMIKYIDFLIGLCYEKQIINGKKYIKFGEKLDLIIRYVTAWTNSTHNYNNQVVSNL